jgi:hypothetical protein
VLLARNKGNVFHQDIKEILYKISYQNSCDFYKCSINAQIIKNKKKTQMICITIFSYMNIVVRYMFQTTHLIIFDVGTFALWRCLITTKRFLFAFVSLLGSFYRYSSK